MTDIAQLREALDRYTPNPSIVPSDSKKRAELDAYWRRRKVLLDAARELLSLREAGALIIVPDEKTEGRMAEALERFDLSFEGVWSYKEQAAAVLDALRDAMPDGET